MSKIKLGYEVETGNEVNIKPSHLIVTGLTQEAGKTTTLEALIKRSKKRAIVFRTKIGEKSFLAGTKIPPYFKDRSDWQFVQGLVEATIKDNLKSYLSLHEATEQEIETVYNHILMEILK